MLRAPAFFTADAMLARLENLCQRYLARMQTYPIKIVPALVQNDAEVRGVGMIVLEQAVTHALELPDVNGLMEVTGLRALA